MTRKQCKHCPWKVSTDPHTIPNGYSALKHIALRDTIALPLLGPRGLVPRNLRIMSCHEHDSAQQVPCVGWLANQAGEGNNIPLRLAILHGQIDGDVETDGPQHETFEDTLPQ